MAAASTSGVTSCSANPTYANATLALNHSQRPRKRSANSRHWLDHEPCSLLGLLSIARSGG